MTEVMTDDKPTASQRRRWVAGRWRSMVILTPFALALYPVLYTWGNFPTLADAHSLQRALIFSALATASLLTCARLAMGRWISAAAALSLVYLCLILNIAVEHETMAPLARIVWTVLLVGWSVGLVIAIATRSMPLAHQRTVCQVVGVASFVWLLQAGIPIASAAMASERLGESQAAPIFQNITKLDRSSPDIYYIVLDAHGRSDVLSREYRMDERPFINALRSRGFYVADAARSNYIQTDLSLASSLNMKYLDDIAAGREKNSDRQPARYLLGHSEVVRALREAGYEFVLVGSDYASTMSMARVDDCQCPLPLPGWFELLLARGQFGTARWLESRAYSAHARHVLGAFETLRKEARLRVPGPRFIFAHIVAPHPPFIFGAGGALQAIERPYSTADASQYPGTPDEYRTGYRNQVTFIDSQALSTIDSILGSSQRKPIIILQGDHGPGLGLSWTKYSQSAAMSRAAILAAIYGDDAMRDAMYDSITPVNIFRIALNSLFDRDVPLLKDRSFYSPWLQPFDFTLIPDRESVSAN